jgi:hypothetical protein
MEPAGVKRDEESAARRIAAALAGVRRAARVSLALRGLALLAMLITLVIMLSLGADRLFRLSLGARAAALALYGGFLAWGAWRFLLRPLFSRLPGPLLASLIERLYPQLGDRLRSAVDFLRDPALLDPAAPPELSLLLKRRVALEAAGELESLDPRGIIDTPRVVSALLGGISAALLVLLLAVLFRGSFAIWFQRQVLLADVEWPYRTLLVVEGFEERRLAVPRGDSFAIRVRAEGEPPRRVSIRIDYERDAARYNLARLGEEDLFEYQHPSATEPFAFVVEGGDYRTPPHHVRILERPYVEALEVTVEPPAYTGRKPSTVTGDVGELAAPAGSTLIFDGVATKPLRRAALESGGRSLELAAGGGEPRRFSGRFTPEEGGAVTVRLEDLEAVPPDRLLQLSIHLIPDRLPVVQARASGLGSMITARARMPLQIKADDDYRVESLAIFWSAGDDRAEPRRGEAPLPPPAEPGAQVEAAHAWEVSTLELEADTRLTVSVGATDNDALHRGEDGAPRPKTGYSPALSTAPRKRVSISNIR